MASHSPPRPGAVDPGPLPERPRVPPDTAPIEAPPERPFSPQAPDVWPGAPAEAPMPGLPPEVGPAIAPTEVPPLGPNG